MSATANFQQLANFIWSVADLLRGPYRPPQYERVMLPLTVLRRFDAVLALSKAAVLKRHAELSSKGIPNIDAILNNLAKDEDGTPLGFHNHSQLDFPKLKGDPDNIGRHLANYINGFSENIRKIFERFEFERKSKSSKNPTVCIKWSPSSPRSTCIRARSTTSPWVWCSKT
jgi:type I restriction enzyme M protein